MLVHTESAGEPTDSGRSMSRRCLAECNGKRAAFQKPGNGMLARTMASFSVCFRSINACVNHVW